jgi:hypothetical protein
MSDKDKCCYCDEVIDWYEEDKYGNDVNNRKYQECENCNKQYCADCADGRFPCKWTCCYCDNETNAE